MDTNQNPLLLSVTGQQAKRFGLDLLLLVTIGASTFGAVVAALYWGLR